MSGNDIVTVLSWWVWIFAVGMLFLPIASYLFRTFLDKGYIFAKTLGIILLSYSMFTLGTLHILQFDRITLFVLLGFLLVGYAVLVTKKKNPGKFLREYLAMLWQSKNIMLFEEVMFLIGLFFLSYIRAFNPEIHGLEKFMDFGFINSIGRAKFFPPKDMWLPPEPINYYYFGHLATAVLTKLSGIPSFLTYNLMLATILALCLTSSFSIGANLFSYLQKGKSLLSKRVIITGILAALLVTLGGNLHTIYTFFKPYENEHPVPPWTLAFSPNTFPNAYWYPNATRFVHNTIHEFPIYSWTVADLHGHVLDISFVLLTIAFLFALFQLSASLRFTTQSRTLFGFLDIKYSLPHYLFLGFLLAVMYMTNAWDGIIYFLLSAFIILYTERLNLKFGKYPISLSNLFSFLRNNFQYFKAIFFGVITVVLGYIIFVQPFNHFFKPFVSGIGLLCAPDFLTKMGHIGPFLFEADHCQHSPWWQLLILYGFFYFFAFSFFAFLLKKVEAKRSDHFVLFLIFFSSLLILIPEFIYAKDIYPAHYRANTMFKLVFQAFMMLGISSAYIFIRMFSYFKDHFYDYSALKKFGLLLYGGFTTLLIILVMIYPYMSLSSYYGDLKNYVGLDGEKYLQKLFPSDYALVQWMNTNIQDQPIILEAQGDSYTDYARISTNTGLPTVLGWTVHEWLWRGSYDIPSPRITDVQTMYETESEQIAKELFDKYDVEYVVVGDLERQKYTKLSEEKFKKLGKIVFQNSNTRLYQVF